MTITPKNYLNNVVLKTYDGKGTDEHAFYGLIEEFGEITGKLRKAHRDDVPEEQKRSLLKKEIGDFTWYVVCLGHIRKSIDFDTIKFKDDRLYSKPPMRVAKETSQKIGILSAAMIDKDRRKEKVAMKNIVTSLVDISNSCGFTMQDVLNTSAVKLFDRMRRNKMNGNGDER